MNRKTGVVLSYTLMIFETLSALLLTPFIIQTLGQAEYGVYKLATAVNSYLLLLDLGIGNAIVKYVSKFRVDNDVQKNKKFLGVVTVFYLLIAVLTLVIGGILIMIFPNIFGRGLTEEEIKLGQKLLCIITLNSAVILGTTAYGNVITAYENFWISKGGAMIQILCRVFLTFGALKLGMGSISMVSINLIMTILCRAYYIYYVSYKIKLRPVYKEIEFSFIKEIIMYSSLIFLQMIATQLNATVDQVLLGALLPSSAVIIAIYGVGTQLVQYFQSVGLAFNDILMPGVVKLIEKKATPEEITMEMIRIGRVILIVTSIIWGGFLVYGKDFIILWAGNDNADAYKVAVILMTSYLFITAESIGTQVLWAKNQHKEQAYLKLIIVLLNIVLTVVLIKWKPVIGAALGTFISLMVGDVGVMNLLFVKKLEINIGYYYKSLYKGILPCLIVSIIVGGILKLVPLTGWAGLVIKVVVMVFVYGILLLNFGMNKYEKELAFFFIKRNGKK